MKYNPRYLYTLFITFGLIATTCPGFDRDKMADTPADRDIHNEDNLNQEENGEHHPDTGEWWKNEFIISFHSPPYYRSDLPELTEKAYRWMRDAHFNLVLGGNEVDNFTKNQQLLRFSAKYGLRALIIDKSFYVNEDVTESDFDSILNLYSSQLDATASSSFAGYYVWDEPHYKHIPLLKMLSEKIIQKDPTHLPYINLYPNYVSSKRLDGNTYSQYVEEFIEIVDPKVLCFDFYPFKETTEDFENGFFENWEIMREFALNKGIPLWGFIQLTPHKAAIDAEDAFRNPTESELRVQIFTAAAFGATGILYYTFQGYHNKSYYDAIISPDGWRRLSHYYMVKRINFELKNLENYLVSLKSIGVYHYEEHADLEGRYGDPSILADVSDDQLLIGEFLDDSSNHFLILVNKNYRHQLDQIEIELKKGVRQVVKIDKYTGKEKRVLSDTDRFSICISPGDGILYKIIL
jgi:hypothetical protein